jgi:hypothetical protein
MGLRSTQTSTRQVFLRNLSGTPYCVRTAVLQSQYCVRTACELRAYCVLRTYCVLRLRTAYLTSVLLVLTSAGGNRHETSGGVVGAAYVGPGRPM